MSDFCIEVSLKGAVPELIVVHSIQCLIPLTEKQISGSLPSVLIKVRPWFKQATAQYISQKRASKSFPISVKKCSSPQ